MGERPSAFDLLYWSSDSTNIPAALHQFVLRKLYFENQLIEPGAVSINNTPIDLSKIESPAYFVSTRLDHIAKWGSTYLGAKLYGANNLQAKTNSDNKRFVLGESGHIAGIINPPSKNKYDHWVNPDNDLSVDAEDWLVSAEKISGSWWTDWSAWILQQDQSKVKSRYPGTGALSSIEDAPGSYVRKRL